MLRELRFSIPPIAPSAYRLQRCGKSWAWLILAASLASSAQADWRTDIGYDRLQMFLGSSLPTGNGVTLAMVEAGIGSPAAYFPDTTNAGFLAASDPFGVAVAFIDGSGQMSNGNSNHATNVVARPLFGNGVSLAPGANTVTVYEANSWLSAQLKAPSSGSPLKQNFKVMNFSWIGSYAADPNNPTVGETNNNIAALRRFDFMVARDDVTAIVGLDNVPGSYTVLPPFFATAYNGISVGRSDGNHSSANTNIANYGPGRNKPDLVAPQGTTSAATASASSVATFLHEVVAGTDAANSETMKAILMAGAIKDAPLFTSSWSHTTTSPLDAKYGAGEVNLYNSYLITQGGQFAGGTSSPTPVGSYGWDFQAASSTSDVEYSFSIPEGSTAAELSIMLTWNIDVAANFMSQTLANLDLELRDSTGALVDHSISTIDNLEHLYLTDLAAGDYTLSVSSDSTHEFGLAWRMSTLFDNPSADFDQDGDVDGKDFLAWQRGFGTLLGASHSQGDADGDGDVDKDDLLLFNVQYFPAIVANSLSVVAVPEPATAVILALGGLAGWSLWRRRSI